MKFSSFLVICSLVLTHSSFSCNASNGEQETPETHLTSVPQSQVHPINPQKSQIDKYEATPINQATNGIIKMITGGSCFIATATSSLSYDTTRFLGGLSFALLMDGAKDLTSFAIIKMADIYTHFETDYIDPQTTHVAYFGYGFLKVNLGLITYSYAEGHPGSWIKTTCNNFFALDNHVQYDQLIFGYLFCSAVVDFARCGFYTLKTTHFYHRFVSFLSNQKIAWMGK